MLLALTLASCGLVNGDDDAAATLTEALEAHQQGRLDEAIELYKEVITEDPQNKFAWYNLGLIHQTRGSGNLAETEYREALAIDPAFVPAMFNLAILQTSRGVPEESVELYRGVIAIQPEYAAAHLNLGFLLIDLGEKKEGKRELEQAVALDPSLASRIPDELAANVQPPSEIAPAESPSA